ncbi:hypothetical protein [Croceitalea sp. P059]|uniref:hypothetical protein n=1 Tax=Croceitalea sp. P059 TaxID=3075601 RepID=UPI002887403B|nr:hypothetical protein [Croceitalea sp. P059]MDT0539768.1 hypothetical protein [Croceitalea sp. P059]
MKDNDALGYRSISWQLEIIIAGGLFYTLFTSTDFFKNFFIQTQPILNFDHYQIILFFGLYILTRTLLIGFGANLLLRTIWVAYMAIYNWYPNGVNYDKLKLSDDRKKNLKARYSRKNRLETLEKWASLSFSFAILFAMLVISTLLVCLLIDAFLLEVLELESLVYNVTYNYTLAGVVLLAHLGVLGRLATKTGKPVIDKSLSLLNKLYYYCSGSFLYQRELLILRSNSKQWILVSFGVFYIVMATLISVNQLGAFFYGGTFNVKVFDDRKTYEQKTIYSMKNRYYEDHLKKNEVFYRGGIQSELIKDKHLKLFVVHWFWFDSFKDSVLNSLDFKKEIPSFENDAIRSAFFDEQRIKYQKTLNTMFEVVLNEKVLDSVRWNRYTHPKTDEEGYLAYIAVDTVKMGRNVVNVNRRYGKDSLEVSDGWMSFPFWKE